VGSPVLDKTKKAQQPFFSRLPSFYFYLFFL